MIPKKMLQKFEKFYFQNIRCFASKRVNDSIVKRQLKKIGVFLSNQNLETKIRNYFTYYKTKFLLKKNEAKQYLKTLFKNKKVEVMLSIFTSTLAKIVSNLLKQGIEMKKRIVG